MDKKQLQQRIVGAIVLVALGVIFIPLILDHGEPESSISGSNIPAKPDEISKLEQQSPPTKPPVPDVERNAPQIFDEHTPQVSQQGAVPEKNQADTGAATELTNKAQTNKTSTGTAAISKDEPTKPNATKTEKTDAAKPQSADKNDKAKLVAWVIQVGSFTEHKKALKLRDKLRQAKYTAYIESQQSTQGMNYRVRVGPFNQREKADQHKQKLVRDFKFKDALVIASR